MALMSCGPAFFAAIVEAMAEAGAAHGLESSEASRMVVATMDGTAAYLSEHDLDVAGLRERVATPGGVTERGLEALEQGGLRSAFADAVGVVVEATKR
jgi:pyrroline-5-carboxylate reductase